MRPLEDIVVVGDNNNNSSEDNDDNDKLGKHKRRPKLQVRGGQPPLILPTALVCTPAEAAASRGAMEIGALLAMLILGIYALGCYETIINLPNTPDIPDFGHHMGENFNLAINGFDSNYHQQGVVVAAAAASKLEEESNARKLKQESPAERQNISNNNGIPISKWPVSLRDEGDDGMEEIGHPADEATRMRVPKFWSPPVHHKQFMTRETAMQIGTCITPDPVTGSFQRGDACPHKDRTIFIGIASYRDFQCRETVESIFGRAKYPERLRVAAVDQIVEGTDVKCNEPIKPCTEDPNQALCKYAKQVDVFQMEAALSVGPVFARHIGYRMYRGEYYATQSDAHVSFTNGWDVDIISQMEATRNEMAVLSTYLTDVQGSFDEHGNSKRKTRPIMCNTVWEGGAQGMHLRHASQPEKFPSIHGEPQLQPWWAAGYSFSRGHFVVNVPYDLYQPMIFQGEEMCIGIRGFTVGYDFYAPERSVCFHHYAVGKNAKVRNKVHHFWENDRKYSGTGRKAMQRLLGIVRMNPEVPVTKWSHAEEDFYGLGGVRTPETFYETFGIDVQKKTMAGKLCKFVDGPSGGVMHETFTPFLRKDGMGIDYDKIDFKFTG